MSNDIDMFDQAWSDELIKMGKAELIDIIDDSVQFLPVGRVVSNNHVLGAHIIQVHNGLILPAKTRIYIKRK